MELGMQQVELDQRGGTGISRNEVAKLPENVASHFDHVLVTSRRLEVLQNIDVLRHFRISAEQIGVIGLIGSKYERPRGNTSKTVFAAYP